MKDNITRIPLKNIHIDDAYWNGYTRLIPEKVLPYQWEILNDRVQDAPPSYCLKNFKIAVGEAQGERKGAVFQDSDVAKWLEAVAYSLESRPDKELEERAAGVIDLLCRAQQSDGYLNTYFTLVEPENRWKNLGEGHELYCAGHLIEAAVAYFYATGKRAFLDCVCRFADLICKTFGPGPEQMHGYPGHPEVELALIKLYGATGNENYLNMAKYFVDTRGGTPNYFLQETKRPGYKSIFFDSGAYVPSYSQSHLPVRKQTSAEGHAVRATYLYCAMADLARICGDTELAQQCKVLWKNMTERRMYVTGSIGSSGFYERFTCDYDLPNDANYSETCASIGLALFARRMTALTHDASYMDTCERALYNTVRSGISVEGDRYFYVNPLEVWPDVCMDKTSRAHVKAVRQKWFDVACCPTNIARTFAALGDYIYMQDDSGLYVNLFVKNKADLSVKGQAVQLAIDCDYPRSGNIRITVQTASKDFALFIRKPLFVDNWKITVNGQNAEYSEDKHYAVIKRFWSNDTVELAFDIKPRLVFSNPLVRADCGKACILRGPEVYCLEECDNFPNLGSVYIAQDVKINEQWRDDLLDGKMTLQFQGEQLTARSESEDAVTGEPPELKPVTLTAVPYGSWGNRTPGEMIVWLKTLV